MTLSDPKGQQLAFVIGAGRSGTSLFSRWLHEIGLNFGADVETVEHINPDGNYEDAAFMELHVDLLKANGFDRWLDIPHAEQLDVPPNLQPRLEAAAHGVRSIPSPAAVKNPLASSFLDTWDVALSQPNYIFVYRDAAEMAQSVVRLRQRNQRNRRNRIAGSLRLVQYRLNSRKAASDERKALLTWLRINDECVRFLRSIEPERVLVVNASSWADEADEIAARLGERLAFEPAPVEPAQLIRSDYFHRSPGTVAAHSRDLQPMLTSMEQELERLSNDFGPHLEP